MDKKYLAFDIEISQVLSEGESDWKAHRPLGITCAAAASSDGGLWNWWAQRGDGRFCHQMSRDSCRELVEILIDLRNEGYVILTWNGLGFDWDILAEESGEYERCKRLALEHIDMMFQFHCIKGFPLGLDAASKGQGLPGKPEGMDGALAPVLWAQKAYHKVLDYVSRDVSNTLALALIVEEKGQLDWISRSGKPNSCSIPAWLPVNEALITIPEPDTSWMSNPWPREKFYEWTVLPELSPLPPFDPTGSIQWDPDEGNYKI